MDVIDGSGGEHAVCIEIVKRVQRHGNQMLTISFAEIAILRDG